MPSHMFSLFIGVLTLASQKNIGIVVLVIVPSMLNIEEISVIRKNCAQPMAPRHPSESYFFLSRAEVSGIYSLVLVVLTWTPEVISPYFLESSVHCARKKAKRQVPGTARRGCVPVLPGLQ